MRRTLPAILIIFFVACASQGSFNHEKAKQLEFAVVENYDNNSDLAIAARDFAAMKDLGIHAWRGSFKWDDYEPERGSYDFDWLKRYAELARNNGITLRPYIAFTPAWAGRQGKDDIHWNDPPADLAPWREFVTNLATTLAPYHTVASYEIYNEEDTSRRWEGSVDDYIPVLGAASSAVRDAVPNVPVVMGGLSDPDADWLDKVCAAGVGSFDVAAVHAYPETLSDPDVVVENYVNHGYTDFLNSSRNDCGGKQIWIDETGFATTAGRSERDQANWWARAIATFAAAPGVTQIGVNQLRDHPADQATSGDEPNRDMGIMRSDRTPKLAYKTLKMLVPMMSEQKITVATDRARVAQSSVYRQLFTREDGTRILFVWNRSGTPITVNVKLDDPGTKVTEYYLDGRSAPFRDYDGKRLHAVKLSGDVRIFEIR